MEGWLFEWWVWVALGLGLAALELITFTYIFLGLASGATLTGGLVLILGLSGAVALGIPALLLIFAVLSAISWAVLRKIWGRKGNAHGFEEDINDY